MPGSHCGGHGAPTGSDAPKWGIVGVDRAP